MNDLNQFDNLADGSWVSTSLCPTLGKMYAQEYEGVCPLHFQEPFGKTLNISFIGGPPFITYNPIGGSAFIVTKLLVEKFQFIPKYIPARSWDKVEENHTTFGMVHWVSFRIKLEPMHSNSVCSTCNLKNINVSRATIIQFNCTTQHFRFQRNKVNLGLVK